MEVIPDAEQGISYGLPAFRVQGKVVAGFAAFKNHLSYLPHSGSVFPELRRARLDQTSTGALRFAVDTPLPKPLVAKLIAVRMEEAHPRWCPQPGVPSDDGRHHEHDGWAENPCSWGAGCARLGIDANPGRTLWSNDS